MAALTLCSVSYKSAYYLDLNWRLTRGLNPRADYTWMVIEKTPEAGPEAIALGDPRFTVYSRVQPPPIR